MRVRVVFDESVREDEPVYVISKAAELSGMHPQTLRQYDRLGLVTPRRTAGRGRRYSRRDVLQLIEIQRLSTEEGINLAGISRIMELQNRVRALEARVELLAAQANPGSRVFMAGSEGDVVSERRKALLRKRSGSLGGRSSSFGGRFSRAPLQLTARVEEVSHERFAPFDGHVSDLKGTKIIEIDNSDHSLAGGRALIVWTPDE